MELNTQVMEQYYHNQEQTKQIEELNKQIIAYVYLMGTNDLPDMYTQGLRVYSSHSQTWL